MFALKRITVGIKRISQKDGHFVKKSFLYKSKFSSVNETKYFFCTADDLIKTLHGIHKHSFMHHIYKKDNFQNRFETKKVKTKLSSSNGPFQHSLHCL